MLLHLLHHYHHQLYLLHYHLHSPPDSFTTITSTITAHPTYVEAPLGYRATEIQLRAASPSTHHPSEIPSPPLLVPSTTHRDDIPEADMPLWKRARFTTPASGFEVRESSTTTAARQPGLDVATMDAIPGCPMSIEVSYGIEDVWDDMVGDMEEAIHAELLACQARALREHVNLLQRQRISNEDRLTRHIQHDHDRFVELVRTTRYPEPARDPEP
ncbi:hypothetical protein Tco_1010473 [Tanacetum coccineum]